MRINLFGGPGSGKSTLATHVFSVLKTKNYNVELVREYIKDWAYLGRVPKSFDQLYIFGKQLHAEDLVLQSKVDHLVTDSPVLMQVAYAVRYGFPCADELLSIAKRFEIDHPSINIFLNRGDMEYQDKGRYESYGAALDMDHRIEEFVNEHLSEYTTFYSKDKDGIVQHIESVLND